MIRKEALHTKHVAVTPLSECSRVKAALISGYRRRDGRRYSRTKGKTYVDVLSGRDPTLTDVAYIRLKLIPSKPTDEPRWAEPIGLHIQQSTPAVSLVVSGTPWPRDRIGRLAVAFVYHKERYEHKTRKCPDELKPRRQARAFGSRASLVERRCVRCGGGRGSRAATGTGTDVGAAAVVV